MVQIIESNRKKSFGDQINSGLNALAPAVEQYLAKGQQQRLLQEENAAAKKMGIDLSGITNPKFREAIISERLKGQTESEKMGNKLAGNKKKISAIEKDFGLKEGDLGDYEDDPAMALNVAKTKQPKADKNPIGGLGGVPLTAKESQSIRKVIEANPEATAEQLELAFNEAQIKPGHTKEFLQSRREKEANAERAGHQLFEEEGSKLAAKSAAETRDQIVREYEGAVSSDLRIDKMIKQAESGKLPTPLMIKTLDFMGLPMSVLNNPTGEEYAKLQNDYVRDVSTIFPGAIKNFEIESYLKTIPQLINSDQGKILVGNNIKITNEAKKTKYEAMKEILKENKGVVPRNLDIAINDRTREKMNELREKFINNTHEALDLSGPKMTMKDEQGNIYDIPNHEIENAIKSGLKISNE